MIRKTNFIPGNYYHIYNRGTDKREIFLCDSDYFRFIVLLYICNNTERVDLFEKSSLEKILEMKRKNVFIDIGAYCLMPNHFHLLVKERKSNGISNFMEKLGTAYAMYFNRKYERSGNLFQGRFKAELADKDEYLRYLFSYIHFNPIKLMEPEWKEKGIKNPAGADEFLKIYRWSSYNFYAGNKTNDPILNIKEFPEYFESFNTFNSFADEWLSRTNRTDKGSPC